MTKGLYIDLTIILKTLDDKKFKFNMTVKDLTVKKLSFLHFKANLCSKNITKALSIDLKIFKTFDGKKFKFKMAVKF